MHGHARALSAAGTFCTAGVCAASGRIYLGFVAGARHPHLYHVNPVRHRGRSPPRILVRGLSCSVGCFAVSINTHSTQMDFPRALEGYADQATALPRPQRHSLRPPPPPRGEGEQGDARAAARARPTRWDLDETREASRCSSHAASATFMVSTSGPCAWRSSTSGAWRMARTPAVRPQCTGPGAPHRVALHSF